MRHQFLFFVELERAVLELRQQGERWSLPVIDRLDRILDLTWRALEPSEQRLLQARATMQQTAIQLTDLSEIRLCN